MLTKKFIGWSAFILFAVSMVTLAIPLILLLFPTPETHVTIEPQVIIAASGVLALLSGVVGLFAFQTPSGKVGVVGGLALIIAVAFLLSYTTIAQVKRSGAQSQPAMSEVESYQ